MNINSINQQYGLYGGMEQSFSRPNQTQTMNMSGQMGPQAVGFMGGGGGQVTAAFENNMNSVWVDLQTNGGSSVEGEAIAEEMLAKEQEKFTVIDTDDDGSISEEEFTAGIQALVDDIAANEDSTSEEATRAAEILANASEKFAELDTDEDGTVSEDEFTAEIQSRIDAMAENEESGEEDAFTAEMLTNAQETYAEMDTDGDGTVSEDEFLTGIEDMLETIQEQRQQEQIFAYERMGVSGPGQSQFSDQHQNAGGGFRSINFAA